VKDKYNGAARNLRRYRRGQCESRVLILHHEPGDEVIAVTLLENERVGRCKASRGRDGRVWRGAHTLLGTYNQCDRCQREKKQQNDSAH
jgi:hypothetical protein